MNQVATQPRDKGKFIPLEKERMVLLSVRIPASIAEQIEQEAQQQQRSKTDVVREILINRKS